MDQPTAKFKHGEAPEAIRLGFHRSNLRLVTLFFRRSKRCLGQLELRAVRVGFVRPVERMSTQVDAVWHLEQDPETFGVTYYGGVHQRQGVQVQTEQVKEHLSRRRYIVHVQRTYPTGPEHYAHVVFRVLRPERLSLGWVGKVPAGLIPAFSLWRFLARVNGDQCQPELLNVAARPGGDRAWGSLLVHRLPPLPTAARPVRPAHASLVPN